MFNLFVCLIIFMLLLLVAGAVAWCVYTQRKVSENINLTCAVYSRLSDRIDGIGQQAAEGRDHPPDAEPQIDEKTERINKQMDDLQGFQLDNYGLRFDRGGDS